MRMTIKLPSDDIFIFVDKGPEADSPLAKSEYISWRDMADDISNFSMGFSII